jgi:hypothetical protein
MHELVFLIIYIYSIIAVITCSICIIWKVQFSYSCFVIFWIQIQSACVSCWRVQWHHCNFLRVLLCQFIGLVVSFWLKWAPTGANGYRIMRLLWFGRPDIRLGWVCGFIRGPVCTHSDRNRDRDNRNRSDPWIFIQWSRTSPGFFPGDWDIASPFTFCLRHKNYRRRFILKRTFVSQWYLSNVTAIF